MCNVLKVNVGESRVEAVSVRRWRHYGAESIRSIVYFTFEGNSMRCYYLLLRSLSIINSSGIHILLMGYLNPVYVHDRQTPSL